jgi:hypothetical protein
MQHLIEKQTVELRLARAENAFELQQKVSAFCNNQLMPALDDLFSRLAPEEKHVRLDELVIDLGFIAEMQLGNTAFLEKIIAQIERAIETKLRDNPERVVVQHKETNVFTVWLYFLENGRLPWYVHGLPPDFKAEIPRVLAKNDAAIVELRSLLTREPTALNRLIRQHDAAFLALIAGLYTGSVQTDLVQVAEALQQFIGQNSVEIYWQSVFKRGILLREKWSARDLIVRTLGEILDSLAKSAGAKMGTHDAFANSGKGFANREQTFDNQGNSGENSPNTEGSLLRDLLPDGFPFLIETEAFLTREQPNNAWVLRQKAAAETQIQVAFLLEQRKKDALTRVKRDETTALDTKEKAERESVNQEADAAEDRKGIGTEKVGNTVEKPKNTEGGTDAADAEQLTKKEHDKVTNNTLDDAMSLPLEFEIENTRLESRATEMYVANAGIVLLHPFLSRLFDNLGLTTGGIFVDKRLTHKALTVLHYLATGETSVLEYNLTLAKLLCELPLNSPVDGHWILTKEEQETCDGLLKVAIDYWSALGNTSPEGLREGFLQRKGKLINRPSGWLLQVERTTIDVLVDRLPWGLGIVKLPWMGDFLTVEW